MLVTVTSPVVENPTTKNTKQGIMTESATAETKVDATAVEEEEPTQKEETAANNSDEAMKNIESKEGEETKEGAKKEEAEEEKKKPKIDPKNWPLRDIKETCDNDVLFGRGGGTNHAKGNKRYRKMVEDRKLQYVNSKRLDKPLVALEIIRLWRAQDPPGRFLKMDNNGLWFDVGDKKAREKTSQALREKAPLIRQQQEEEKSGKNTEEGNSDEEKEPTTKNTRFAEGTTKESKGGVRKAVLARDHSLGREYLQAGETMTLDGFSWRDPIDSQSGQSGPPPPGGFPTQRKSSGSMVMPPPEYRVPSIGPPPPPHMAGPPPPNGYFPRTPTDDYQRNFQQPPVMPGYSGYGPHQRSGSWTHGAHAMPPVREHSLAQNPLRNASASHPAPINAFDAGRNGSGYWGDPRGPPPPPGQQPYAYREQSGPYYNPPPPPPTRPYGPDRPYGPNMMRPPPPPGAAAAAPPYSVDPAIARTWSGQSGERDDITTTFDNGFDGRDDKKENTTTDQAKMDETKKDQSDLPRPQMVKRMTSNQNENLETKPDLKGPSVKRAALNRDSSAAANRLKMQSLPEYYTKDGKFDPENAVNALTDNLEQSTLTGNGDLPKRAALSHEERKTTLDSMAMDLMVKPPVITANSRSSTIEALALDDLDSDPVLRDGSERSVPKPSALSANNRMTTMEACFADLEKVTAKPIALSASDRISTRDYLDLGDEPLTEIDFDRMYDEKAN